MNGSRASLAHLYRRAGFGGRPDEIDAAVAAGFGATVERLLDRSRPDPDTGRDDASTADRNLHASTPRPGRRDGPGPLADR